MWKSNSGADDQAMRAKNDKAARRKPAANGKSVLKPKAFLMRLEVEDREILEEEHKLSRISRKDVFLRGLRALPLLRRSRSQAVMRICQQIA
jgi:hypothetical protein